MKFKLFTFTLLTVFAVSAHANKVQLFAKNPMGIEYRMAYQDSGQDPVLGPTQSIQLDGNSTITFELNNHLAAGVVIESVNGHVLPDTAKRFNHDEQCSIATNAQQRSGKLTFESSKNSISCSRTTA